MRIGQHCNSVIAHRVKVNSEALVVSRYCLSRRVITGVDAVVLVEIRNQFCGVRPGPVGPVI